MKKTKQTIKERYRLWKKWKKRNLNSRAYQYLVLLGLIESPTFRLEQVYAIYEKRESQHV